MFFLEHFNVFRQIIYFVGLAPISVKSDDQNLKNFGYLIPTLLASMSSICIVTFLLFFPHFGSFGPINTIINFSSLVSSLAMMNISRKQLWKFKLLINRNYVYLAKPFSSQTQTQPIDIEYENAIPHSKIPGPTKFELLRGLLPGGKFRNLEPVDMFKAFRTEYGTILRFPGLFGRKDSIFTFDPNDFQTVFRTEGVWPNRKSFDAFEYFRVHVRPETYKNMAGLANDQGESWGELRTAVNPIMLKPRIIKAYIPAIDEVSNEFVAKMKTMRDENQEMPDNFAHELKKWALESTAVIAVESRLGVITNDNDPECQKLMKSVKDVLELGFQAEFLPSFWRYFKTPMFNQLMDAFNTITDVVKKYVDNAAERISKENENSMQENQDSVLRKLLKVNSDYAFTMAMDMLLAGIDTTPTTVGNLLYHLAVNPSKQDKLREEIFKILPDIHSKLTPESLNSISYMRACLKESMRLTPVVPANLRGAGKDLVLQGYQIPKNTDVVMAGSVLHLDEEHYENSKEFIPERWLNEKTQGCPNSKSTNPFTFLPFGFGSRMCIGKRFAEMETTVLTFRILREFKLEWHYGPLKFVQSLVVAPSNKLKFRIIPLK